MNKSLATSLGMRAWYMRKPSCIICRKTKCFKGWWYNIRTCSRCFLKATGHSVDYVLKKIGHDVVHKKRMEMITQYRDAFINKPVLIEGEEWWYMGCFIQKQNHPDIHPYVVFKDNDQQTHIGTSIDFNGAKDLCKNNRNTRYKLGIEDLLWQRA
jgi:hypothetical protein